MKGTGGLGAAAGAPSSIGMDDDGGERTFKANFTGEGVRLLRARVKEKLRELMGDYSDDTLAVSTPPQTLPHPLDRLVCSAIYDPFAKTLAGGGVCGIRFPSWLAGGTRRVGVCGFLGLA